MHYYKKNIGDYAKKAGRLTMLQHGAYTLLIDSCYDRERFPTLEEAIEWTWASNQDEKDAVIFVLSKFFVLENGVYVQNRIKEELDVYHIKAIKNKQIALEREENRRRISTNREQFVNEPSPNHKPITNNQEPILKTITPDGFDIFWKAYPKKKSKGDAEKVWKKLKPNAELQSRILKAINLLSASEDWKKQNGQFIPYPATWLNAKGWEDQVNGFDVLVDRPAYRYFKDEWQEFIPKMNTYRTVHESKVPQEYKERA